MTLHTVHDNISISTGVKTTAKVKNVLELSDETQNQSRVDEYFFCCPVV